MPINLSGVDYFRVNGGVLELTGNQTEISGLNLGIAGRRPSGDFRVAGTGNVREVVLTSNDDDDVLNVGETFTLTSTTTPYTLGVPGTTTTTTTEMTVVGSGRFGTVVNGLLTGSHGIIVAEDANGNTYFAFPDGDMPSGVLGTIDALLLTGVTVDDVGYDVGARAPLCFTRGTLLDTPEGLRAIEDLRTGDLVLTRDNGARPVRWIGSRVLSRAALQRNPNMRPIRIKAGALGPNTPATDLTVSPQHRILVRSKVAQRMFGTHEVLVAAKQLLQLDGVDICDGAEGVEYFHMLFDGHEVVFANGAEAESLYTGPQAIKSVGPAALAEILAIFPELRDGDHEPQGARMLVSGRMGRKLVSRHLQHHQPLVAAP
ncbi:Hint domain-containing protein [Paracoccus shandongensis]|uniref:Hint domain-containing protein n=1 Tax=Paracoccus shandongensis TaxID=2816048 RepID=UPI001F416CAA|nr:Hint domain-containing protein [Paracoccus shandongensis]